MSIPKRKILENAQKYLQKGQLDRALKEYQAAVQADPRDCGTRLKMGDVHLKRGDKEEAINAYLRVADQFMKDGFDAKAVALYKQIQKIDPARSDVNVPLAELYQRLGLSSEALSSLQAAADAFHREGRKREALELLRKMATLDPGNTNSRLKIADLLQQAGMRDEAMAELDEVARELERQGDAEGQARVHERLIEIDRSRFASHLVLARITLDQSRLDEAEAHARNACEVRPDAPEALESLAEILRAAGRDDELEPLYRRLAEQYRERGDESKAREILQRFVATTQLQSETLEPVAATGAAEATLVEATPDEIEVLDDTDATPLATPAATAPPSISAAPASTVPPEGDPDQWLAEAKVYLRYQKIDRALASLESAIAIAPLHAEVASTLADLLEQRGDAARAATLRAQVGSSSVASTTGVSNETGRLETSTAGDRSLPNLEVDVEFEAGSTKPPAAAEDVNDPGGSMTGLLPLPDVEIDLDAPEIGVAAGDAAAADASISDRVDRTVYSASLAVTASKIVEEIEEAEFYFQQNLFDEAEEVYSRVLAIAPNHPQALLRLGEIAAARGEDPSATTRSGITSEPAAEEDGANTATDSGVAPAPESDAEGLDFEVEIDLGAALDRTAQSQAVAEAPAPGDFSPIAHDAATGELATGETPPLQDLALSLGDAGDSAVFGEVPAIETDVALGAEGSEDSETSPIAIEIDLEETLDPQLVTRDPLGLSITRPDLEQTPVTTPEATLSGDTASGTLPPLESSAPSLSDVGLDLPDVEEATLGAATGFEATESPVGQAVAEPAAIGEPVSVALGDDAPASGASTIEAEESTATLLQKLEIESEATSMSDAASDSDAFDDDATASHPAVASEAAAEPEAAFDLAAELAGALDDEAAAGAAQEPASSDDDAFSAVFREFKQGVKRVIGTGDYRTHYDLGIAYREMGLLDDASGEFAEAANSPELRLSSLHLLALCALDAKRPRDAAEHLSQALSLPDVPADQLPALRFDLARAHGALGDLESALALLEGVAETDPTFPGLADLRASLRNQPAGEVPSDDDEPLERFDDLIADAGAEAAAPDLDATAARVATTGAETPAPPAQPPADGGATTSRRRKFSFL